MLFTITKELSEPEECYVNIYLLSSDKLEFAPPSYFSQTVKVDKQPGANELSAQCSTARTRLEPIMPTETMLHIAYCSNEYNLA